MGRTLDELLLVEKLFYQLTDKLLSKFRDIFQM